MATRKPRTSQTPAPQPPRREFDHPAVTENRALQFRDLDPQGQQMAEQRWSDMGSSTTTTVGRALNAANKSAADATSKILSFKNSQSSVPGFADARGALSSSFSVANDPLNFSTRDEGVSAAQRTLKKARTDASQLGALQASGLLSDVPTTIASAASRRVELFDAAAARSRNEGDIRTGELPSDRPFGAGWYFKHARKINNLADSHGIDREVAYAVSGSMSPQNSPDNEFAALSALAAAHSKNHKVTAKTREGARRMGIAVPSHIKSDADFLALHESERSKNFNDLTPDQIRESLGNGSMRKHVDTKVNIEGLALGGTGLTRGIGIIRGHVPLDEFLASGPNGGPKVASYVHNIRMAGRANANEEAEYYRRLHEASPDSGNYFQQPTLFGEEWEADPWGKADSTEGTLDPEGPTAEDTWMRSISANQPNEFEKIPESSESKPMKVGKFVGSSPQFQRLSAAGVFPTPEGQPNPNADTIIHALNNEATVQAAEQITDRARRAGRNVGAGVPSMGVQETTWSEYRVEADKDPEYAKASGASSEYDGAKKAAEEDFARKSLEARNAGKKGPKKPKKLGPVQEILF